MLSSDLTGRHGIFDDNSFLGNGVDAPMFRENRMRAPKDVKQDLSIYFWILAVVFAMTSACEFAADEWPAGINAGLLGLFMWYLVREDCEKMTQCCVMWLGLMSLAASLISVHAVMDAVKHGRVVSEEAEDQVVNGQKVKTVVQDRQDFYDPSLGQFYNFQSAMMVISIVPMCLGAILAYITFAKYPASLWSYDANDLPHNQNTETTRLTEDAGNDGQNKGQKLYGDHGHSLGGGAGAGSADEMRRARLAALGAV